MSTVGSETNNTVAYVDLTADGTVVVDGQKTYSVSDFTGLGVDGAFSFAAMFNQDVGNSGYLFTKCNPDGDRFFSLFLIEDQGKDRSTVAFIHENPSTGSIMFLLKN